MKLHCFPGYIQNIHLVEYEHGCMLLDGCSKVDFSILKHYFKTTLKRPLSDLKVVVVTHMHPDHAGCAHLLRAKTGAQIVSGEYSSQWYSGISGRIAHLIDIALALWVAGRLGKKRRNIWYSPSLNACKQLTNNQTIEGFEDWKIITTPGHTDRDISLVNDKEKVIYVADLIVKVKKQLAAPFPVYFPKQYKESLNKVSEYQDYQLLMAHVPSIQLNRNDIQTLIQRVPDVPKTNLISVRNKIRKALGMTPSN